MSLLVIGPDGPDARFNDMYHPITLERYSGFSVHRINPELIYREGGYSALEHEVLRSIAIHKIRIVIYALGTEFDFHPEFLENAIGDTFRVLILGDDEHYFDVSHRYYAQCFDLVLTSNPLHERYRLYGIDAMLLPGIYSTAQFNPGEHKGKTIDVSFIGAMRGKVGRVSYAEALKESGVELQLFGSGTEAGVLSREMVAETYRCTRINLNFTGGNITTPLDAHLSINRRVRQVKGRCSMISLCGSFVLSEYAPGLEKLFDIGKEIDVFHDEEELVEKAKYYLQHEDAREKMAARAHIRALEYYDEAKYWARMGRIIEERATEKEKGCSRRLPLYLDSPFWSAFGSWRFKYIVLFLFSGRLGLFFNEIALLLQTGRFNPSAAISFGGLGLHVACQGSKPATWAAGIVRGIRRFLKGVR
ncbi:glycosyltransferase [Candidatus Nitronereus thalassa]|uniref:Glycosyltransferase n=1 Tax=Candidatus Nitronereus thalassa TaxID=3020898 RepID=A0ABU3K5L8_9BACT|nr:glycosyltransferase [Candidatus Nitronereus thalassa]MDT7041664.1 glycosyltransferase [Candidatus Nitronereus thalassa]